MTGEETDAPYGEHPRWQPAAPRLRLTRLLMGWAVAAAAVWIGAAIVPGVTLAWPGGALPAAAAIGVLNAILPPLIAALRLPYTLALGFLAILVADALVLLAVQELIPDRISVASFGDALLATLVIAAASIVLDVILGTNDDTEYSVRVTRRIARRQGGVERTDVPGIVFLEIDGLALPVLRRAMQSGSAPAMARWVAEEGYRLAEWEPDLSSQTGASQAGILLGSNEDIPAFRWVEKERGVTVACSSPEDCAAIEARLSTGEGLLSDGGASRGNLLSGDAEAVILTVSRMDAEKRANPGYRAFLANGFNVTRALVLFGWEVLLEWVAAGRAARRDVRPRGHRGGIYPLLRGFMCVIVRDLVVFGVLTDMLRGRPAVYATFASYDEVAHHSGLERADTLEALRKLDQQFERIARARRFAPRPYEIVVLSDHGQTQGATFKQRNGYGLDDLVRRSLRANDVSGIAGGDEQRAMAAAAVGEATGRRAKPRRNDVSGHRVVVLGSGNLGLIYLMEARERLTYEQIEARHPDLLRSLREHPHVGWVLVRSGEQGAIVLGPDGSHRLRDGHVTGTDPLAPFSPTAARHLLRTDGFAHCADIMVGSFYDPELEEGCAFEELVCFHGGLGGPQTRPFILHPPRLRVPDEPLIGAEAVHRLLKGWREQLAGPSPGSDDALARGRGDARHHPSKKEEPVTQDPLEEMGPIDYIVLEWPGRQPQGEVVPLLLDLVDRGIIRILDIALMVKDEDGSVAAVDFGELDGGGGGFEQFDGASSGLLTQEDLDEAAETLAPGTIAALLVWENRWAAPVAIAVRRSGGQLVASGRIPIQAILAALEAAEGSPSTL